MHKGYRCTVSESTGEVWVRMRHDYLLNYRSMLSSSHNSYIRHIYPERDLFASLHRASFAMYFRYLSYLAYFSNFLRSSRASSRSVDCGINPLEWRWSSICGNRGQLDSISRLVCSRDAKLGTKNFYLILGRLLRRFFANAL